MRSPDPAAGSPVASTRNSPSETLELVLAHGPNAPSAARRAVGGWLTGQVGTLVLDDLLLMVSELVTNSVRHAGAGPEDVIRIRVHAVNGRLHLAVEDAGRNGNIARRPSGADHSNGFGLNIVNQLASKWGVTHQGGTSVWAEMVNA